MKTKIHEFLMREARKEKRKKLILILGISLITLMNLVGQTVNNSIVVFAEDGERLILILNGLRQNQSPETNVKVSGLNQASYKAKVIFDKKGIPDCDKTIPMMWAAEPVSNTEFVFSIAKDKKGNYKWKFVSQGPVSQSSYALNNYSGSASQSVTNNQSADPNSANMNVNTNVPDNSQSGSQVTTSTTTSTANGTAGVNINLGLSGTGLNFGLNVNDGVGGAGSTNSTTTTTSYTTSTVTNGVAVTNSGSSTQVNPGLNSNVGMNVQVNTTGNATNFSYTGNDPVTTTSTANTVPAQGNVCTGPMPDQDFTDAKRSISDKSFEDTKLTLAKQIAESNCLSAEQVKEIMGLFSFEQSKLELAKYCYRNCYDKKNYYKINDAFTFEASTTELNEYVKRQ
ncbi:MAG: DUF4476 domain-containing protein [Bacteroidia bacterium]